MAEIQIIKGDSFYAEVEIRGLAENQVIDKLLFSCRNLAVCKELERSDDLFVIEFTSQETENFSTGQGTFDLTAYFVGNAVATVLYNNTIQILPKVNCCNG